MRRAARVDRRALLRRREAQPLDIALEGITISPTTPPQVLSASVNGKQLVVRGESFASGAALLMDGEKQKKTANDDQNWDSMLIARKSGAKITPGQTVALQVRNPDGQTSNEYSFTRPLS